jgi:hypothetical protein
MPRADASSTDPSNQEKTMKPRFPKLAITALTCVLTLGMTAPAIAQDVDEAPETGEHSLPGVKARCQEAIDERLDDAARAQAELNGITALTADHERALDDIIDRTQSGLTRLSNEIDAVTERPVVLRLCAQIAPGYRVYLVVLPQTHLTVAADRSQLATEIGYAVIDQLDEAITRAATVGADVTEAQAYRDTSLAHLEAADAANNGVADAVLAVTPDSYNHGDGRAVLEGARGHMRSAHSELQGSHVAGKAAAEALRDALDALG